MTTLTSSQAIAGLYVALLGRAPEANGFDFWLRALDGNVSRETVAQTILGAPETTAAQPPAQSSTDFVISFYDAVLGRAPDTDGLAFWAAALDAQGGVGNTAARAALVLQIVDVLSTPLAGQPAGMSNADYERALSDRALFANKIEFGVYFASELKSNDPTLAKAAMALVTSDPASVQAATNLANGVVPEPPVVNPPVVPPPTITVADSALDIANKFAAYQGTAGTVDASGMAPDQLKAVAAVIDKVASITDLSLALADVSDAVTAGLLGKALPDSVTVNATGATATELAEISTSIGKIANGGIGNLSLILADLTDEVAATLLSKAASASAMVDANGANTTTLAALAARTDRIADAGITGTVTLTGALSAGELSTLTGIKVALAATVAVDATGMDVARLEAVGQGIAKVDALSNLPSLALGALSATAAGNLLAKTSDSAIAVNANDAGTTQLLALAANIAKVAPAGITGTLVLGSALSATALTALLGKTSAAADVQVNAAGMSMTQLEAVVSGIGKVDTLSNLPRLELANLQDNSTAELLAKSSAGVTALATGASNFALSLLATYNSRLAEAGITGDVTLSNARTEGELTALLGSKMSSTANVSVDATGMSAAKLTAVSNGIVNVDRIAGLQVALAGVTDTATANLLSKAVDGTARVDATNGSNNELGTLAANVGKLATDGITGTFTLAFDQSEGNLGTLLGAKTSAAATVTVNATSMNVAQLTAVAQGIDKVDVVTSLTFRMQDVGDAVTAGLLSKSAANSVRIDVNGASAAEATTLLGNLGKIANGGLSGLLDVSYASLDAGINTMLSSKIAQFSGLTVAGTASREIMSFPGLTTGSINLRIDPAGGGDLINLGNASATLLISNRDAVRNGNLSVNDTTTENLLRVESTGTVIFHFSTAAGAFDEHLAFQPGVTAMSTSTRVDGSNRAFNTLGDVIAGANASFSSSSASTNEVPVLYTFRIEGGNGLQGNFTFLNDADPVLTIDDLIMTHALGAMSTSFIMF